VSLAYTSVGWNRTKRRYDACIIAFIVLIVGGYTLLTVSTRPAPSDLSLPIVLIRGLGLCAIAMLHVVLWIGPACRLSHRFLPLLYNRRHLGVSTFLVALTHGVIVVLWYHGFGVVNPLVSLLTGNTSFFSLRRFPFELLGVAGLLVLFLMAATSHDFWLKNLSPKTWRTLHSLVYPAYALLVMHIVLGALQSERSGGLAWLVGAGAAITIALHLIAATREHALDRGAGVLAGEQTP
jgi:sulfoxide reductase heme-binding subunit YedZ